MCKLNILCKLSDGNCNCHQLPEKIIESHQSYSGLLCSILSFIKEQPEIMRCLSEASNLPVSEIITPIVATDSTVEDPDSPPRISGQDSLHEFQISILSDIPSKFIVGRAYSVMAQIVDKSFNKSSTDKPNIFQAVLLNKYDEVKQVLAEVETSGVALFKKIIVPEVVKNCSFGIRVKGRLDVADYIVGIKVKDRKKKLDTALKKPKLDCAV